MIISAFPGVGKTYLYNEYPKLISDSDSSKFSWLEDGNRNPNFVKDYVDHIEKEASKNYLFLFHRIKKLEMNCIKEELIF